LASGCARRYFAVPLLRGPRAQSAGSRELRWHAAAVHV